MAVDLTNIYDHPAEVLAQHYNRNVLMQDETGSVKAPDSETVQDAINVLRLYEQGAGVTFAALDNGALEAIRESYTAYESAAWDSRGNEAQALAHAVSALLGLDDD